MTVDLPGTRPYLSIVVPCFNEEGCLEALHRRLAGAAASVTGNDYEIIFVNDGSTDRSWPLMEQLCESHPRLTAVNLSRNHGHQLALTAGLDLSRGSVIFVVDADLQDPPELLGPMLEKMRAEGADVVYGVRGHRQGETRFKLATAALFYRLLARATETPIPLDAGDFRLMSRRALDVFRAMPEQARFIRGMVAWAGFKQVPFVYEREERFSGSTKYPLSKMVRFALDALTGFSSAPLKLASHAGLLLSLSAILVILYTFWKWASGETVEGWTSLMVVVLVLGAVQMFVLGLIGEYLGRLYHQAKNRPLYIVQEVKGGAVAPARLGLDTSLSGEGPATVQQESRQGRDEDHRHNWPPIGAT